MPCDSVLFVSLFGLTELYLGIAKNMAAAGTRVHWISTNEYYTEYLVSNGVDRADILQLIYRSPDFLDAAAVEVLTHDITRCEEKNDLTVNQVLLMDRFISERPRPDINEFICLYYRDIKRFLLDKAVTHVFAEPTNISDLVLYMICRELGVRYVSPRDMRYPPRRVVFFDGYNQEQVMPIGNGADRIDGRSLLDAFARRRPTPYYFDRLNRQRIIHPGKIARAAVRRLRLRKIVSGDSLTHYDIRGRIKLTVRRAVNSFYLRRLCRYDDADKITGKLAFYPLHVQPENSIDVLGPYVNDQLKLIKDIRRALPFDTTLVVKEHPNFLGMKSVGFFRELKRVPNVSLIRHDVSAFDLYRKVNLVLTVSGTAAYEAGLLGIPAVTFSPMYFGGLSSVFYISHPSQLKEHAPRLLNGFRRDFEADCRFMESLVGCSREGYWTDPLFDRSVLDPDNIDKLANAFVALLGHDRR